MNPLIKQAVDYVNYIYYSKPMRDKTPLLRLTTAAGHQFKLRERHGILHAIAVMEAIDDIDKFYKRHLGEQYTDEFDDIAAEFSIDSNKLLDYIRIAALFHDAARQGDGRDVWEDDSANACKKYLLSLKVDANLAEFIADLIRYKDKPIEFNQKYNRIKNADYARQLLSTADTLEIMRVCDNFDCTKLPICKLTDASKRINPSEMIDPSRFVNPNEYIIPELVLPHRQKIIDEGRVLNKAKIIGYEGHQDKEHTEGLDLDKMSQTYYEKSKKYGFAVVEIDDNNLNEVLAKAIRGIDTYLTKYQRSSGRGVGIKLYHNGLFSPRFHGDLGIYRAKHYKEIFQSEEQTMEEKLTALYAILASWDGKTLQEEVIRSFGQANKDLIWKQLSAMLVNNGITNQLVGDQVARANLAPPYYFPKPDSMR